MLGNIFAYAIGSIIGKTAKKLFGGGNSYPTCSLCGSETDSGGITTGCCRRRICFGCADQFCSRLPNGQVAMACPCGSSPRLVTQE